MQHLAIRNPALKENGSLRIEPVDRFQGFPSERGEKRPAEALRLRRPFPAHHQQARGPEPVATLQARRSTAVISKSQPPLQSALPRVLPVEDCRRRLQQKDGESAFDSITGSATPS